MHYLIVSITLGFFFVLFNKYIAKKINLYDVPDSERKIHHKKTALTGGIFFFINIIIYLIFEKYFITNNYSGLFFSSNSSDNIFILSITLLFLIGFIDDKIKLDHNLRFLL
jgi:UDP-N-acetylmuramyl pentapeptide phosphotransferase/UDP-N-acetylglucosamine-1-phosphate transferase